MNNEQNKQISFGFSDPQTPKKTTVKALLGKDGESFYFGRIFDSEKSNYYLKQLLENIYWKKDEAVIYGKHYITDRKIAWYGDENYAYRYSGTERYALNWTKNLLQLKKEVENLSQTTYNACLLNLYEDGSQGMGWHSDDEKMLDRSANIASLSFGAERRFDFRHNQTKEKVSVLLEHGSLLIMSGETQVYWKHQLPKTKKVTSPRVNLTFRRML